MIYAGTGHRPNKLDNAYSLEHPLAKGIMQKVKTYFVENYLSKGESLEIISGMALGFDTYLIVVGLELKKEYPHLVKLIAAIPCLGHGSNWPNSSKVLYEKILEEVDETVLVTNDVFKPYYMQVRNEYMVNRANRIMSLWDGTSGGTGNCIKYALKENKEIINLNPSTLDWNEVTNKKEEEDDNQLSLF